MFISLNFFPPIKSELINEYKCFYLLIFRFNYVSISLDQKLSKPSLTQRLH